MREIIFYSEVRIKLEMFVGDDKKIKKSFSSMLAPFLDGALLRKFLLNRWIIIPLLFYFILFEKQGNAFYSMKTSNVC